MKNKEVLLEIQQEELTNVSSSKKTFEQEKIYRNRTIDFFRVIFCFIIFLFHTIYLKGKEFGICNGGYIGVEFFFRFLAFLCASLLHLKENKNWNHIQFSVLFF